MSSEPTRYFVVHLQKSAGTSLRDKFRFTFGDEAIYPDASDGPVGHSVISLSNLCERWTQRRDEMRVVAGHFPLSTVDLLDAPFVTLSILRSPVDRVLSYLRHQKMIVREDADRSLEEIYDDPFRFNGLIRNHMLRMFSIGAEEMGAGDGILTDVPDTPDRLARAQIAISGLDAFGLQARFDEFWCAFAAHYRLDPGEPVHANATRDAEVSAVLIDRIRSDNALDMELYRFAEDLYQRRGPLR